MKKYKQSLRDLWASQNTPTYVIGVPMGEEKEKAERIPKTMAKNIPNFDERLET